MRYWTESNSLAVGFAIWVLQRDGLRVPPFDVHADGDGQLRSIGLDGPTWSTWVAEIVTAELGLGQAVLAHHFATISDDARRKITRMQERASPIECWGGSSQIGNALEGLWDAYHPIGEAWARTLTSVARNSRISTAQERRLQHQLEQLGGVLPTLHIYLADYVDVVALALPPASCVVGVGPRDAEGRKFVDEVTRAARALAVGGSPAP
jgi:hypothetical protein